MMRGGGEISLLLKDNNNQLQTKENIIVIHQDTATANYFNT
jgi:hypothetical protein